MVYDDITPTQRQHVPPVVVPYRALADSVHLGPCVDVLALPALRDRPPVSKRTGGLARRKNDAYDTPREPVRRLLPFLLPETWFIEPCAGSGLMREHLESFGHVCAGAFDIVPRGKHIATADATTEQFPRAGACFITNPPWTRSILHPIIVNLSNQLPTWLLFDSDWANNVEAAELLDRCDRIVPVGRVRWLEGDAADKGHSGMDNCAWYRFDATHYGGPRWMNKRSRAK